jgi:hypothetical protein
VKQPGGESALPGWNAWAGEGESCRTDAGKIRTQSSIVKEKSGYVRHLTMEKIGYEAYIPAAACNIP